ncbi:hypothetical protein Q648_01220 [Bartonella quintana JK 12]|uniref:Dihydroxy-acid/6-phosphogluconate dehydratase C-terminal domain-containing protein n=2 Tax=Bartonella quintana TaxID=803 RepID=W3TZN3_BARQI|nr:hypothetical protein Q651_00551 [Bartonella quintana BQ2-D70]ETS14971.1 hypothetical protein Q650_00360 [Bartonella quintana JK 73rel]ETS16811.1 hypothetical protein Q649_00369 [Bartonella quintana JK 73]ETS17058.1 hypothetical protein Q648_01220 [Bartonella quintana JK 12]ETS19353.1 hypothetical protein Q647_00363 [Bartonella quintana JK 7]KEC58604.1 hypothetical protein O93_00879 [Bartonella quintana JK 19]KEC61915.1 hypothetical protein O91_00533 [Bartonella quintana JK 31]KEC63242.1 h
MQEMRYHMSSLKSKGLGKVCTLVMDGSFQGRLQGFLSDIFYQKLLKEEQLLWSRRDIIEINIPNRTIHMLVDGVEIIHHRAKMEAKRKAVWQLVEEHKHKVSKALRAYVAITTSAAKIAVRNI